MQKFWQVLFRRRRNKTCQYSDNLRLDSDKRPRSLTMQLVLATNNHDKVTEIRQALDNLPITVLTCDDFLEFPDPEESGDTLEANARIKAIAIAEFTGYPALADDSGLEVDALGGAPGVISSRYAEDEITDRPVTYRDNYEKLLRSMREVPSERRTARFRTVIAIAWRPDHVVMVEGVVEGVIAETAAGIAGFGYDPVFYYPPMSKRFSEMTLSEKNSISHRGKAVRQARALIEQELASRAG